MVRKFAERLKTESRICSIHKNRKRDDGWNLREKTAGTVSVLKFENNKSLIHDCNCVYVVVLKYAPRVSFWKQATHLTAVR
jgi:hypothetical protein